MVETMGGDKFLTKHPRNAVRRVAPYVSFISKYLAGEISKKRDYKCGTRVATADCDGRTGIGGWFPARDQEGRLRPWLSSWVSLEITRKGEPSVAGNFDSGSLRDAGRFGA